MRCPRCGNENPEQNRFCGMCGTTLLAPAPVANKPQPVSVGSGSASPRPEALPPRMSVEPPPTVQPTSRSEENTSISGPSFLGLNDPGPSRVSPAKRATLSIDPTSAPPASNLHYLLEDEEEHRGSGLWKFALILIALALAAGFGYLRWKNHGLPWLDALTKKPAATEQQVPTGDSTSPPANQTATPPTANPSITPEPQAASPQPGIASQTQSSPNGGTPAPLPNGVAPAAAVPADTSKPVDNASPSATPDKGSAPASANNSSDQGTTDSANANTSPDTSDETPAPVPAKPKGEATPKPRPSIPSDPVSEARKYLYGKGAPQDCDRGLHLLKPVANAGNAKAMIEMGALYSAGLCTPRDLPTAYRWFARALHKEPDNQSVQSDLQKLWGEMTQPERQLAIKMSQ